MTTLSDVVLSFIDKSLQDVYTSIPATITDVSKLTSHNKVSVQPALDYKDSDDEVFVMPVLSDCPVQWPSGGGATLTFPLKVGDDVLVVFSMRSISEFQASSSGTVQPYDNRTHSLSDAYVVPCIYRNQKQPRPHAEDVEIRYGTGEITIKKDNTVEVFNDKASVKLTPAGDINLANGNGDYNINANGTHSGNAAETWSMTNGTGEFVDLLSQTLTEISNSTVNTLLGPQPLINKATIQALIALLDSFKE